MDQFSEALDGGLFQSEMWKSFQKSRDKEIFEGEIFWGTIERAPLLGKYGEVSRGPTNTPFDPQVLAEELSSLARKHQFSFLRLEPQNDSITKRLSEGNLPLRKAPFDVQPKEILMLPIDTSEEQILAQMKSKTRYNIRLAQKKGVTVKPLSTEREKEQFLDLLTATAARKNIHFHSRKYYRDFVEFFSGEYGQTFLAVKDGKVLAGGIVVIFQNTAYYIHGGSSDEGRNSMAPHLLQWEQIRFAKSRGCTQYDFGGIARKQFVKGKDWSGITRFKDGFAPKLDSIVFPGTYDIIFSPFRYHSYQFFSAGKKLFS